MNINQFLTRHYRLSQEDSIRFIQQHQVQINGSDVVQRQKLSRRDEVTVDGEVVRAAPSFQYYAFYKPRGIECSLHPDIENNLLSVLPFEERVYPIGRLDKDSEGLLLLTDDGKLYQQIALSQRSVEKEYRVTVDQSLRTEDLEQMANGMLILGKTTRPAFTEALSDRVFRIVLTQGMNRQIRRMCHKLGYRVLVLQRIRIASVELGDLEPGAYRKLDVREIL